MNDCKHPEFEVIASGPRCLTCGEWLGFDVYSPEEIAAMKARRRGREVEIIKTTMAAGGIKWFMEEWDELQETGCNWTECVPIVCPEPQDYVMHVQMPLLWEGAD